MKKLIITVVGAVLFVGCATSQQQSSSSTSMGNTTDLASPDRIKVSVALFTHTTPEDFFKSTGKRLEDVDNGSSNVSRQELEESFKNAKYANFSSGQKEMLVLVTKSANHGIILPEVQTLNRQQTTLELFNSESQLFPTGPQISVLPTIEGEKIKFTAIGKVREKRDSSEQPSEAQVQEFITGDFVASGSVKNGEQCYIFLDGVPDKYGNVGKASLILTLTKAD